MFSNWRRQAEFKRFWLFGLIILLISFLPILGQSQQSETKKLAVFSEKIPLTAKDLEQFSWRNIGPWAFSGRITNFAVPPGQSQAYYVLTATGGLWKTVDGGIHFDPIFEKYGNQSMGYLAIAPSDANILYLGTGEPIHSRAAYHGNGLWKSTDAGKTWIHLGLDKSFYIPKIEVDSKNPDIVYVACEGKLYDDQARDDDRGLYKSTDGGKTWTRILDLKDRVVGDFVIDPRNSDVIIAASYKVYRRTWTFLDRQEGNYLWKSTDGGKTWNKLTNGLPDLGKLKTGRNALAIYPKNPNIVYLRMDEEVNLGLSEKEGAAFYNRRNLFRDNFYFNKLKDYKINPELAKFVKFTPVKAEKLEELETKLNDLIKDPDFQKECSVNWKGLIAATKKVYARDEELTAAIEEIEKILKTDEQFKDDRIKLNKLILSIFLADSPGFDFKNFKITDRGSVSVKKDFQKSLTYDSKYVKDEAYLLDHLEELAADPELLIKLKINPGAVLSQARNIYKDKKEFLEALKEGDHLATEFDQSKGRYQTLNRCLLDIIYGPAFKPMEPVKKAGVIYRSEDLGESWKRMTEYKLVGGSEIVNQVEAGYYGRLVVDPNDDKVLIAPETQIVISRDAGKTFQFTNWEANHKCHVDSRAVWIDPLNSKHILNGNDGGVDETWDGGQHWSQKETIPAQQFYDISVDNELPYNVMGGTQDNGCWFGPSMNRNPNGVYPADWLYLPSGDGFYVVRDWWNPEYIYWESQFGASSRMNFKTGQTISLAARNTPEEEAAGAEPQRYQWNAPIYLSPHNPGIVFVCSQYVHRSLSHGDPGTWETISPDLSKHDPNRIALSKKTNLQYATIYTFAESPKKPGIYWVGTDDGNLQVSANYGQTWTNITANFYDSKGKVKPGIKGALIPYDRWVVRVLPSRFEADTCYVAYSGYRTNNEDRTYLFVTKDLGKTWEDISGGMNNPVNDLEEDPDNPDVLYLATDYGLYVTFDRGQHWSRMSSNQVPDVVISDLAIQPRDRELIIATYGRGVYIADIYPFKEFSEKVFSQDAYLFNPRDPILWQMNDRRGQSYGEFAVASNPPLGVNIYYYLKNQASKVTVTIKDINNKVVQELSGPVSGGLQKVLWGLNRKVAPDEMRQMSFERRMRGNRVEPGLYRITLSVNDKEIMTKDINVLPDPLYK
ncbi:MAG: VPS10 domain-containing protein [Candidatus Saccharicenans sp.]